MKKFISVVLSILFMTFIYGCDSGSSHHNRASMIIDHTCTDLSAVPADWIESAKSVTVHYAHTSHGSQLTTGMNYLGDLDNSNSPYYFAVNESGTEGLPAPQDPAALRIYDGNPPETYIEPDDYWDNADALARTGAVVGTGDYMVSMWSWCGQQSSNSEETVQAYLDAMQYLEKTYPDVLFVYMTGHTDGGSETLTRNNEMVRTFCRENNKTLYDFADIESWDPDGNNYPDTTDACDWCADWCAAHPDECTDIPATGTECAHSHGFNCIIKSRAFWWMLARVAGWDGN